MYTDKSQLAVVLDALVCVCWGGEGEGEEGMTTYSQQCQAEFRIMEQIASEQGDRNVVYGGNRGRKREIVRGRGCEG